MPDLTFESIYFDYDTELEEEIEYEPIERNYNEDYKKRELSRAISKN
jgi:hypothetical protein